jgi:hypothetical protein
MGWPFDFTNVSWVRRQHGQQYRAGPGEPDAAYYRLNHEQRRIVGGVVATLQGFDDVAARRWIEQHQQSILDELRRAQ